MKVSLISILRNCKNIDCIGECSRKRKTYLMFNPKDLPILKNLVSKYNNLKLSYVHYTYAPEIKHVLISLK